MDRIKRMSNAGRRGNGSPLQHAAANGRKAAGGGKRGGLPGDVNARDRTQELFGLLLGTTAVVAGAGDYLAKVRQMVGLFVPALGAWAIVDILGDDGRLHREAVLHADAAKAPAAAELERTAPSAGALERVRHGSRVPAVIPAGAAAAAAIADGEGGRSLVDHLGAGPCMMAPVAAGGNPVGMLTFVGRPDGPPFGEEELGVAAHVAARAALLIENARLAGQARRNEAELNRRVQGRTAELEAINRDLEAFSYSVSHDLRAPLRAIDGFARTAGERYAGVLDAEGVRLLGVISSSAKRMGQLIDDLLLFAQVGRREFERGAVDMAAMAHSVVHALLDLEPGRTVDVRIGELPPAWGNASMVRQILVNLVANALKFTRPRSLPLIEIGCRPGISVHTYFVRDNGIGFDMKFAEKLFGVFQRLHSAASFEGTGIGLALVQRIVVRHGGTVWAEAKPNGGAAFYFSLPAAGGEGHDQRGG